VQNGRSGKYTPVNPGKLNVGQNECLRCGMPGHFAYGTNKELCPLKTAPITAVACSKCRKGGHIPALCPRKN